MIYLRYTWVVLRHKFFVLRAGLGTVPLWRLLIHDWTKFGKTEFGPYARRFGRGKAGSLDHSQEANDWRKAWHHHWHLNPHHWEYWLDRTGNPLEMPETYLLEMIADWKGASRAYTGSWEVRDWYMRNRERMTLHSETRTAVETLLIEAA